jgi:hypothetical protein
LRDRPTVNPISIRSSKCSYPKISYSTRKHAAATPKQPAQQNQAISSPEHEFSPLFINAKTIDRTKNHHFSSSDQVFPMSTFSNLPYDELSHNFAQLSTNLHNSAQFAQISRNFCTTAKWIL